ncbi:MAG TPA: ankyrin repeat domain-containing protein [Rhabdochlamydiaceae bacterium]|nr:ankyrin repeat domain-containing protein [Rhabdochlamydiaceae bacterium]
MPLSINDNNYLGIKAFTKEGADPVAVEAGHEDLVLAALKKGARGESSELLKKASESGNVQIVRSLVGEGAKVESSLLFDACKATNKVARLETVQFLINQGADVNVTDSLGYTPLTHIIKEGEFDPDLIKLLIKNKAEIKSQLNFALKARNVRKVALLLNISDEQAEACIKNIPVKSILANINAIDGIYCWGKAEEMVAYAKKMLDTLPPEVRTLISPKAVKEMNVGLVEPKWSKKSKDDIVDAIQNNRSVTLPLGFKGHVVTLNFYDGYMVLCNRGGGCKEERNNFDVFRIDPKKFTHEILETLIHIRQNSGSSEFTDYYYDELPKLLSPLPSSNPVKDVICKWVEELSPKDQKVGNCSWANLKDGFLAVDALMRFTEIKKSGGIKGMKPEDVAKIKEEAKAFAKGFSEHARLSSLVQYLETDIQDDHDEVDLFVEALHKINKRERLISWDHYPYLSEL